MSTTIFAVEQIKWHNGSPRAKAMNMQAIPFWSKVFLFSADKVDLKHLQLNRGGKEREIKINILAMFFLSAG